MENDDLKKILNALIIIVDIFRDMWVILDTRLKELDKLVGKND